MLRKVLLLQELKQKNLPKKGKKDLRFLNSRQRFKKSYTYKIIYGSTTMVTVILLLIIVAIVAIFSVQNAMPVAITFLFWKFEASLAIVIFLSVLAGMIAGAIIVSLIRIKPSGRKIT